MADRQLLSAVNREGSRCSAKVLFPAARRGSKSVPRLSIVVPFVKNVNRLEKTLLSILENRPRDCEVILVHNGNYEDPYDLGADEVVLIETEEQSSVVGLINEGVFAACSNVISVLLPGDVVEAGWERSALSMFQDQGIAAVCMPTIVGGQEQATVFGLDTDVLPRRSLGRRQRSAEEATPTLHGTFFRRRVLLALDGFFDHGSTEAAEMEFGLALRSLALTAVIDQEATVEWSGSLQDLGQTSYHLGQIAGQLAVAYSQVERSGVEIDSLVARIGHLATGLISPSTVAERLGWVLGTRDGSLVRRIAKRIERAREQLGTSIDRSEVAVRRAA